MQKRHGVLGTGDGKSSSTSEALVHHGRIHIRGPIFSILGSLRSHPGSFGKPTAPGRRRVINLTAKGKWIGIAIRCGYLLINFSLLALADEYMDMNGVLVIKPSDFSPEKEGIIRRLVRTCLGRTKPEAFVTRREFQIRAFQVGQGVVGDFLLLSLYHGFCAVI